MLPSFFRSGATSTSQQGNRFWTFAWLSGPFLVIGVMILVAAFTGRDMPASDTVTFPVEVYAPDGISEHVESVTIHASDVSGVDSLYIRAHQPLYTQIGTETHVWDDEFDRDEAASIRINNGAWIDIDNENVDCAYPERALGCIDGIQPSPRFTMDADDFPLQDGTNTVEFRYNGTDGNRSGYRVLGFGLMEPGDPNVQSFDPFSDGAVDHSTLDYVEYPFEAPPDGYDSQSDIQAGQDLWNERYILTRLDENEDIRASCADCHAQDGRDLAYFNYSNRVVEARGIGHGLSQTEAKQVAAYIRSVSRDGLVKEDGTPYDAPGTPYDPPYQPGPEGFGPDGNQGPDEADQVYWAAGAGLDWALDYEREEPGTARDQLAHLFPKDGNPANGVDRFPSGDLNWHHVHHDSTVARRSFPVQYQFPDWNNWLPIVHPIDIDEDEFFNRLEDDMQDVRAAAEDPNVGVAPTNEFWPRWQNTVQDEINGMGRNFRQDGWRHVTSSETQPDLTETTVQQSSHRFRLVRMWDIMHANHLEDKAQDAYCEESFDTDTELPREYCEPLGWLDAHRLAFDLGPHISSPSGIGNEPHMYKNGTEDAIMSHIWYQMQLVINHGTDPYTNNQTPMDWSYQTAFVTSLHPSLYSHSLLYAQTNITVHQLLSNDFGVDAVDPTDGRFGGEINHENAMIGWNPTRVAGMEIYDTMHEVNDGADYSDVTTAIMRSWWDYTRQHDIDDFIRQGEMEELDERIDAAWNDEDHDPEVSRRIYTLPEDHATGIYNALIDGESNDWLSDGIVDSIGTQWGQEMWPETSDPRFDEIANFEPPSVGILQPTDEATFTAPASFEIVLEPPEDLAIDRVEFFVDGEKIGTRDTGPLRYPWTNVPPGTYEVMGEATMEDGTVRQSDEITVTVEDSDITGESGTQEILLQEGWNLVSSRYAPEDLAMDEVLEDVASDIAVVQDQHENAFRPDQGVDEIGLWNPFESYLIYSDAEQSLTISGQALHPESTSLHLREGWNHIPYLNGVATAVDDALGSVVDDITIMKDYTGNTYIPEQGIDDIGLLETGQGYRLHMESDTELKYPLSPDD